MEERDFYVESEVLKPANLSCLFCHQTATYDIRWVVRMKKKTLPSGVDEGERARFQKARSYMVRREDSVRCKNARCGNRFEVSGLQSIAFL